MWIVATVLNSADLDMRNVASTWSSSRGADDGERLLTDE